MIWQVGNHKQVDFLIIFLTMKTSFQSELWVNSYENNTNYDKTRTEAKTLDRVINALWPWS